jgi:hypothetical protein
MALITADLRIPDVVVLFPATRRWHRVKPCPGPAAWRRHQRRKTPFCEPCRTWRAEWDKGRVR